MKSCYLIVLFFSSLWIAGTNVFGLFDFLDDRDNYKSFVNSCLSLCRHRLLFIGILMITKYIRLSFSNVFRRSTSSTIVTVDIQANNSRNGKQRYFINVSKYKNSLLVDAMAVQVRYGMTCFHAMP